MDALAGLLKGPRARGAFVIRACLEPPRAVRVEDRMAYLTGRRLALAVDRPCDSDDDTVAAVAREVGFGSAFAPSTAFKRVHGVSRQGHRTGTGPAVVQGPPPGPDRTAHARP
ncbi:hypothetical protein ACF061_18745 [Streptomyces sp. NPDC015220]|uniref:hypothetical protein n=1 Tax=Streptomyces sp. NPDC015220 TaxID=3364947 RepID=UPI0036FAD263